jgi:small-conductance mechanosensitive channel
MDFLNNFSFDNLISGIVDFLPRLGLALLIYLLARLIASSTVRLVRQAMKRRSHDPELIVLLELLTRWGILGLGIVSALNTLAPGSFTSLIAGLGIVGFTLGFALQDVAKNFVAGVLLLIQQPFDIGNDIEVAGFRGTVLAITLRTTELQTWDGCHVLIPNGDVYVKPIINFSRDPHRRLDLTISFQHDHDLDRIKPLILESLIEAPGALQEPKPEAFWTTIGPGAQELKVFYWIDSSKVYDLDAQSDGIKALSAALAEEGADIPYSIKTSLIEGR